MRGESDGGCELCDIKLSKHISECRQSVRGGRRTMQVNGEMSEQIPAPPESQEMPQINEVRFKFLYCSPFVSKLLYYCNEMSLKTQKSSVCASVSRRR